MGHQPNHVEAQDVGADKTHKDYVDKFDAEHGCYKQSDGGKPTVAAPKVEPNKPTPFTLTK
jgi:hypothetical protein